MISTRSQWRGGPSEVGETTDAALEMKSYALCAGTKEVCDRQRFPLNTIVSVNTFVQYSWFSDSGLIANVGSPNASERNYLENCRSRR
jgi:hypothetical protein